MYGIAVIPLIRKLSLHQTTQVLFVDDATAGGQITPLREWWEKLQKIGPDYGYYPNAAKTWLIVKEDMLDTATEAFKDTGINIICEVRRHFGAALGTRTFVEELVQRKVADLVSEVSSIAVTHPHAAYTHGLSSRWTFLARVIPEIGDLLCPLEEAIRHRFLTALTGKTALTDIEGDLLALPVVWVVWVSVTQPNRHHNTTALPSGSLLHLWPSSYWSTMSKTQ